MKTCIALASTLCLMALPALAGDPSGKWRTEANDEGSYLIVDIAPCGDKTCGTIVEARNAAGQSSKTYPNLGRKIITDMVPDGENAWTDGEIWAPDEDKTYSSNMALKGDILSVEGCVLVFCRGQDWAREE